MTEKAIKTHISHASNDALPKHVQSIGKCFDQALENYISKKSRPGYQMTLFSRVRHSFKKSKKITQLEEKINNADSLDQLFEALTDHFTHRYSTFKNYSFNSYLIDALKTAPELSHIDWNCFTPRAVNVYRGLVYRGMSRAPENIFNNGLSEREHSDYTEDYLKPTNGSVGISTSKDFDTALKYTTNYRRVGSDRYIYAIDYHGHSGFDVLGTIKSRGLAVAGFFGLRNRCAVHKKEVNISGNILKSDIVGAFKVDQEGGLSWSENKFYQR